MKRKTRIRIFAAQAAALIMGVALSASIYLYGSAVISVTRLLVEHDLPAIASLSDLKADVIELEPVLYEYYITMNRDRFLSRVELNARHIDTKLRLAQQAFPDSTTIGEVAQRYAEIQTLARQLDQTLSAAPIDQARARVLIGSIGRSCAQIVQDLDALVSAEQEKVLVRAQGSHDKVYGMIGLVVFFTGMLLAVIVIAGHFIKAYFIGVAERDRERELAEQKLVHQAYHDDLTGLPNRRMFQDHVVDALSTQGAGAHPVVMFVSMDRLKQVNDGLGHLAGDRLLQAAAQQIEALLQGCDAVCPGSMLYRLEGDLFAVLMPRQTRADAPVQLATRIAARMAAPLQIDARDLFATLSIGIAVFPTDGKNAITLVKNAASAMHAVKQRGGNGYQCYTQEMNARALELLELGNDLRRALERDELSLHYQPQIELGSGRLIGMEALLRWRHPERGAVAPAEFIPLAEESGLIVPIGEWTLRAACLQAKAWHRAGFPALRIAVNISARQFLDPSLPDTVARILAHTDLPPATLELEITESAAMRDVELTIATLNKLRQIGVRLALDDFGTGYSSLSYLKRFPIDTLKVDQSFIRTLATDLHDAAIAQAVIRLGHSLNLKVIAEGVETPAQRNLLQQYGCDEMQGYLFSRPLPAEALTRLLEADRATTDAAVLGVPAE